jgi:hypothetical protein
MKNMEERKENKGKEKKRKTKEGINKEEARFLPHA